MSDCVCVGAKNPNCPTQGTIWNRTCQSTPSNLRLHHGQKLGSVDLSISVLVKDLEELFAFGDLFSCETLGFTPWTAMDVNLLRVQSQALMPL